MRSHSVPTRRSSGLMSANTMSVATVASVTTELVKSQVTSIRERWKDVGWINWMAVDATQGFSEFQVGTVDVGSCPSCTTGQIVSKQVLFPQPYSLDRKSTRLTSSH